MTETLTLSFERTVPCSLAHRRALGEVFVADTAPAGMDEFVAAIQIPRAHSLWFDRVADYHDPLSTVEAIRQAMIVVGHRYLSVPAGTPASLQRISFTVEDLSAYRDSANSPLEGIVRIRAGRVAGSFGYVAESSFEATLTIDASVALTLHGGGVHFPPEAYERFRAHQQATRLVGEQSHCAALQPIDPVRVGRRDIRNVVVGARRLAPSTDAGSLIPLVVDQRHPSFFDHPYDHVPGPLLLEGCRQAAVVAAIESGALTSPVVAVTACAMNFTGFAEIGPEIGCSAVAAADPDSVGAKVELGIYQFDTRIAECSIELSPYPELGETY
jgi:hypothetical protein